MGPGHRRRVLVVSALGLIVVLAVASGSSVLRPALMASRGIVQRAGAARPIRSAIVASATPAGSDASVAPPATVDTLPAKAPGPVASASRSLAQPTPTPTARATPTPAPTSTLEEFWQRYLSFEYDSLDRKSVV